MARKKRSGGRVTPKGTRPPHLRLVDDPRPAGSPVDQMIDSGGREILEGNDPVAAETWASAMLGAFESARWQARLDRMEVPSFEEALLQRCRQRGDRRGVAVAAALASVLPPSYGSLAASVTSELSAVMARSPGWVGTVGHVTPTRGFIASDVFGDQDSLIVGFRQEGEPDEHALVVLVDHNLSGQAKDAWLGADVDDVVAGWRSAADPHMRLAELPLDEALGRLRDAVAMSDLWDGDTELRTEDFARHRALIWARLRRAGLSDDRPSEDEVPEAERELLVDEFMASAEAGQLTRHLPGTDIALLARYLVNLRSDYEGRPLRWSPIVVSLLLGDLAPRKLLLKPEDAAALPGVLRAFVRFSAGRTGLDTVFVEEILEAVDELEPEFLDLIGDPAAAGPAKALLATLQARGVDLSDVDAIEAALEQDPLVELPGSIRRRTAPPGSAPADVIASAEGAPVLARFGLLSGFYGEGRKLTQTGQPTLADARELVVLLGTDDHLDPTIGGETFRTRSAAELLELAFTIRWALSAGALRKEHGKLRATASWAKLANKPLQRWLKATDALLSLGPLTAFHAHNRYRGPNEMLDEFAPEILHLLGQQPMAFEKMLDWICERADLQYEWLSPYMQDPAHRRSSNGWDLDQLASILGWAGIADRVDAKVQLDRWGNERLAGGTLQLTRVGRWWVTGH